MSQEASKEEPWTTAFIFELIQTYKELITVLEFQKH